MFTDDNFSVLPEYNPYDFEESNGFEVWTGSDKEYRVSEMADAHIRNAIKYCKRLIDSSNYESEEELWRDWIKVFETELVHRNRTDKNIQRNTNNSKIPTASKKPRKMPNVKQFIQKELEKYPEKKSHEMYCEVCNERYTARTADLKRGWGINHTKSCTAYRKMWKKEGSYYPRNKFVTEL